MTDGICCSIIIPVLNEAGALPDTLRQLQSWRQAGHEVIVVDGGSDDGGLALSVANVDQCLGADRGRALQMNLGASQAKHDWLIFLHADTELPATAMPVMQAIFSDPNTVWGRFDINLSGRSRLLAVIAWFMNTRSRLTGIATGDQAIFVRKSDFIKVGSFPAIALMEDIELSSTLKQLAKPVCLSERVISSGRRWEHNGVVRTVFKMWLLRFRYFLGSRPDVLEKEYNRGTG